MNSVRKVATLWICSWKVDVKAYIGYNRFQSGRHN